MKLTKERMVWERKIWFKNLVENCPKCKGQKNYYENNTLKQCDCMTTYDGIIQLIESGFPVRFLSKGIDDIHNKSYYGIVSNYISNFINNFRKGNNLLITLGNKNYDEKLILTSILAKNIARIQNAPCQRQCTVWYTLFEELVQLSLCSSSEYSCKKTIDSFINTPDVLILDGLGSETGLNTNAKHNARLLDLIVKNRYNNCQPTIICTDLKQDQLSISYLESTVNIINQNFINIDINTTYNDNDF